jgi:hypothetical protein
MGRVTLLILCLLSASGCQSLRPVPLTADPNWLDTLRPGDDVVLTLRDGRAPEIEVARIEASAIIDDKGTRFETQSITSVRVERADGRRTTALIILCAAAVGLGVAILLAIEPVVGAGW